MSTSSPTPVKVTRWARTSRTSRPASGHTCAIKTDSTLWCWGERFDGKLGYDGTTHEPVPRQVAGTRRHRIAQVSPGYSHTCAVKTDGSVYCWGANDYGQLGAGGGPVRAMPGQVTDLASGVAFVSAAYDRTCVRKTDETIWCWGSFAGDGTNVVRVRPVRVSPTTTGFTQLDNGGYASCAARGDGSMACWGGERLRADRHGR